MNHFTISRGIQYFFSKRIVVSNFFIHSIHASDIYIYIYIPIDESITQMEVHYSSSKLQYLRELIYLHQIVNDQLLLTSHLILWLTVVIPVGGLPEANPEYIFPKFLPGSCLSLNYFLVICGCLHSSRTIPNSPLQLTASDSMDYSMGQLLMLH